jgi:hypothetical protein
MDEEPHQGPGQGRGGRGGLGGKVSPQDQGGSGGDRPPEAAPSPRGDTAPSTGDNPVDAVVAGLTTGDDRVDAALAGLSRLPGQPMADHVAILEEVHGRLRDILGELAEDQPGQEATEPTKGRP